MPVTRGSCEHCHTHNVAVTLSNGDELLCRDCMKIHTERDRLRYGNINSTEPGSSVGEETNNDAASGSGRLNPTAPSMDPSGPNHALEELTGKTCAEFSNAYLESLENIHNFCRSDIVDILSQCDMDTLSQLHKAIRDKFVLAFPNFKDLKFVNRKTVRTIVADIFSLGYCCINNQVSNEAKRIFTSKEIDTPEPCREVNLSQQDIADLIETVARLQVSVIKLEADNAAICATLKQRGGEAIHTAAIALDAADHQPECTMDLVEDNLIVISSESSNLDTSHNETAFVTPKQQHKKSRKMRRLERENAILHAQVTAAVSSPVIKAAKSNRVHIVKSASEKSGHDRPHTVRRSDLYIGAVDASTTSAMLAQHIRDIGVQNMTAAHITVLSDNPEWKSFRANVPATSEQKVLDPSQWPDGVRIRPFRASSSRTEGADKRNRPPPRQDAAQVVGKRNHVSNKHGRLTHSQRHTTGVQRYTSNQSHQSRRRNYSRADRSDNSRYVHHTEEYPRQSYGDDYPAWSSQRDYDEHFPSMWY